MRIVLRRSKSLALRSRLNIACHLTTNVRFFPAFQHEVLFRFAFLLALSAAHAHDFAAAAASLKSPKSCKSGSKPKCYKNPSFASIVNILVAPDILEIPTSFDICCRLQGIFEAGRLQDDIEVANTGCLLETCLKNGGSPILEAGQPRVYLGCYSKCEFNDLEYCDLEDSIVECESGFAVVVEASNDDSVYCCEMN
eukprot:scaffold7349_cov173-Amphora_coffeaeformis.AAC.141